MNHSPSNSPAFQRHSRAEDVVEAVRQSFVDTVVALQQGKLERRGNDDMVRVVLTGGGVGTKVLSALSDDSGDIDWQRVLIFFGDERFVPRDDAERNALAARRHLLEPRQVPEEHIFEIAAADPHSADKEADLRAAASAYEEVVTAQAAQGFDLHLMGMGGEGHINSLFPHTAAQAESERLVVAVTNSPKPPAARVTLTMPAIARAERVWLLVAGSEKAEAAVAIATGADAAEWPAAGVRGHTETIVFIDEAAAAQL